MTHNTIAPAQVVPGADLQFPTAKLLTAGPQTPW
jgi:hypothetical protein